MIVKNSRGRFALRSPRDHNPRVFPFCWEFTQIYRP